MKTLRIATRQSPLALWQARHVAGLLMDRFPGLDVTLLELSTEGDRFLSAPLSTLGGKNLFVKEIEQALLDGRADLAVHSLKDVTAFFPPGLVLAAVPLREDARDAWVSPRGIAFASLVRGARVGTSSLRRTCQLLARRRDLEVVSRRGNVASRLWKTREEGLQGTVLAFAGLKRLGLEREVTELIEPEQSLPAVGQGALALECLAEDTDTLFRVQPLEDRTSRIAVDAERGFLSHLEGGCSTPMAAYAVVEGEGEGETVWIRGLVGEVDGRRILRDQVRGPASAAAALGVRLAQRLLDAGAGEILARFAK